MNKGLTIEQCENLKPGTILLCIESFLNPNFSDIYIKVGQIAIFQEICRLYDKDTIGVIIKNPKKEQRKKITYYRPSRFIVVASKLGRILYGD